MKITSLLLATSLVICCAQHCLGDVMTFNPSKDTSLFEDANGGFSGGGSSYIYLGRLGSNGSGLKRRATLAFDLSAIPASATITAASLTVRMDKGNGGNSSVELHRLSTDWGEGTAVGGPQGAVSATGDATWIHTFKPTTWTNPGGDFATNASATTIIGTAGGTDYTWDSTPQLVADVQSWVSSSSTNFGWIAIGDEANLATAKEIRSRESGTNQPSLSVTFVVPEPSLTLPALLSIAFMRRRSRPSR